MEKAEKSYPWFFPPCCKEGQEARRNIYERYYSRNWDAKLVVWGSLFFGIAATALLSLWVPTAKLLDFLFSRPWFIFGPLVLLGLGIKVRALLRGTARMVSFKRSRWVVFELKPNPDHFDYDNPPPALFTAHPLSLIIAQEVFLLVFVIGFCWAASQWM